MSVELHIRNVCFHIVAKAIFAAKWRALKERIFLHEQKGPHFTSNVWTYSIGDATTMPTVQTHPWQRERERLLYSNCCCGCVHFESASVFGRKEAFQLQRNWGQELSYGNKNWFKWTDNVCWASDCDGFFNLALMRTFLSFCQTTWVPCTIRSNSFILCM